MAAVPRRFNCSCKTEAEAAVKNKMAAVLCICRALWAEVVFVQNYLHNKFPMKHVDAV